MTTVTINFQNTNRPVNLRKMLRDNAPALSRRRNMKPYAPGVNVIRVKPEQQKSPGREPGPEFGRMRPASSEFHFRR